MKGDWKHADTKWKQHANCRGCDPELFFPERGSEYAQAKSVCQGCVVRAECLDYALASPHEKCGIWGGTSERERRKLRVQLMKDDLAS